MEHTIQNRHLTLTAAEKGGLLTRLVTSRGQDLLFDGDPAIWPAIAPVCFPWCSSIEGGAYTWAGKTYRSDRRHGFARDLDHTLVGRTDTTLTYRLTWPGDEESWPWPFTFETCHRLDGETVRTVCTARNDGDVPMPVQMGYHPAFRVPFAPGTALEDYRVRFEKGIRVPLHTHLFDEDSIPFGNVGGWARLECAKSDRYIQVTTAGFYKTLLWSKPGIPGFLCIEPWEGFAGHQQRMEDRPGASLLAPGESRTWTLEVTFHGFDD